MTAREMPAQQRRLSTTKNKQINSQEASDPMSIRKDEKVYAKAS